MSLTLYSWNVNGIRAAEKKGFLDWLTRTNSDVVAIQETKAHPDQLSKTLLGPAGYTVEWVAAEKKGYSGVATYSRVRPQRTVIGLGEARFDADGRTLISEFEDFVLFNDSAFSKLAH
jgi:exodeoxyribonuclease-3